MTFPGVFIFFNNEEISAPLNVFVRFHSENGWDLSYDKNVFFLFMRFCPCMIYETILKQLAIAKQICFMPHTELIIQKESSERKKSKNMQPSSCISYPPVIYNTKKSP